MSSASNSDAEKRIQALEALVQTLLKKNRLLEDERASQQDGHRADKAHTEAQLKENQRQLTQLSEIIDRSMDFISSSTPDEQLQFLNPAGRRMIGWPENRDISALSIRDAHPAWAFEIVQNEGIPAAVEKGYWRGETALKSRNGTIIPTDQTIFGHKDPETGELVFLSTIIRDISEVRQKEREIQRLQNFLYNIVDSMPSAIVAVDTDGNITHWNREIRLLSGFPPEKVLGQPLKEVFPTIGRFESMISEVIRTGNAKSLHRQKILDRGEIRFIDVAVFPLVDSGAVVRVDNVTERVKVEELLIQSEKMKSVGELAAGMAHEINNPLSGILQNAQLLQNRLDFDLPRNQKLAQERQLAPEKIQAYLAEQRVLLMVSHIRDAGKRASKIIRNMLDFSRRGDADASPHDVVALVNSTVALVQNDYDLKTDYDFRKIKFSSLAEGEIPKIMCESGKIQQVLLNLLVNSTHAIVAKSFTESERPSIQIVVRPLTADKMVEIAITDNGVGMDEATTRRIFEPFYTTKPVGRGTGLGLSVAYYIVVEEHQGTLKVRSIPGKGTTFTIQLPLRTT